MALTAFCSRCQRTVYVREQDTPVCPVCSSPLLEAVEPPTLEVVEAPDPEGVERADADRENETERRQTPGSK